MDDTQPYRAKVRDRCVHSNFSYLHRSITVNLMMFLLTIYQSYSKGTGTERGKGSIYMFVLG